MSMFLELFSDDVDVHGDGEETTATFNAAGWPFNIDFSEHAEAKVSAYIVEGDPETLTQLDCVTSASFITITFPEPIPGGEFKTVPAPGKGVRMNGFWTGFVVGFGLAVILCVSTFIYFGWD